MVFYVTMEAFLICHFLWISLQDLLQSLKVVSWLNTMAIIETNFGIFCILAICKEMLSWMIKIWMGNHLVSDSKWNIVNLYFSKIFTSNDK